LRDDQLFVVQFGTFFSFLLVMKNSYSEYAAIGE
jgi:hypothetical protein